MTPDLCLSCNNSTWASCTVLSTPLLTFYKETFNYRLQKAPLRCQRKICKFLCLVVIIYLFIYSSAMFYVDGFSVTGQAAVFCFVLFVFVLLIKKKKKKRKEELSGARESCL